MAFSVSAEGGMDVVKLSGPLNVNRTLELGPQLREFASNRSEYCVFDLAGVEAVDSAGVGLIVEIHRILRGNGGGVALAGGDRIAEFFKRYNFENEMTCFNSVADAVEAYTSETLDCDLESLPNDLFDTDD